jgi:predicted Fe-Mo cluster-binding NifX family protein
MIKISVPVDPMNRINNHFGHCDSFKVYTVSGNNQITDIKTMNSSPGCGCKSNIPGLLSDEGVSVLIAGGIGTGAIGVLNNFGIQVIRGCAGDATEAVIQYMEGTLTDSGENCSHHDRAGDTCNK